MLLLNWDSGKDSQDVVMSTCFVKKFMRSIGEFRCFPVSSMHLFLVCKCLTFCSMKLPAVGL